jgi:uncharacterized protein (DUF2252 family)
MTSVIDRIESFNTDRRSLVCEERNPDRIQLKYSKMAADPFSFLRGTCHLFYEDLPQTGIFKSAPPVWICGDLHLQNFGSFKGNDNLGLQKTDRKLVYFDINDFDESVLAPCSWDLARFLVSLLVADLGLNELESIELSQSFIHTYAQVLITGKACTIHRETAQGMVKKLLQTLKDRKRKSFIRTHLDRKLRALKRIPNKIIPVAPQDIHRIHTLVSDWGNRQPNPDFFKVLDIAQRIAGTGSLGLERYLILIEGKGYPHRSYLLDLKAARSSCLQPYLPTLQPLWTSEGHRIVEVQSRIQESPPAMLNVLTDSNSIPNGSPNNTYVLRELQPTADKLDLNTISRSPKQLKTLIETLASIVAWGHLRSGGRQHSAIADELIAFGTDLSWQADLLDYARYYAQQVRCDQREFQANQPH